MLPDEQGAKTGTGGHLPGNKVKGTIAAVRGLKEGEAAISPARGRRSTTIGGLRLKYAQRPVAFPLA